MIMIMEISLNICLWGKGRIIREKGFYKYNKAIEIRHKDLYNLIIRVHSYTREE